MDLEGSRRVRSHLSHCEECSSRAERMREESQVLSSWIGALDAVPSPERRAEALAAAQQVRFRARRHGPALRGRVLLRAAAVAAVLVVASVTTPPVRAWVGARVEGLVGPRPGAVGSLLLDWLGRAPARPAAATLPAVEAAPSKAPVAEVVPAASGAGSRPALLAPAHAPVAFAVQGPEVVVDFAHAQAGGTVTVAVAPDGVERAEARVTGGAGGEAVASVPGGVEVRNAPRSLASYEVTVPSRVRIVRVRVPGNEDRIFNVSPSRRGWAWTVNLQ
jgi:hypothetical protein